MLTHLSDGYLTDVSPCEPVERVSCGTSDDAIVRKAHVLLELLDRLVGSGSENAVHPVRVETELTEPTLEFRYVITPHHRIAVIEESIPEAVVGLDKGIPRLLAANPVNHQATVALKPAQRSLGLGAELLRVAVGAVADQRQPSLEVANGVTCIAAAKRQPVRPPGPVGLWCWIWHAAAAPGRD